MRREVIGNGAGVGEDMRTHHQRRADEHTEGGDVHNPQADGHQYQADHLECNTYHAPYRNTCVTACDGNAPADSNQRV